MSRNFLALTIGPVNKTLKKAKTTRELWVASYFLSTITEICIQYEPLKSFLLSPQPVEGKKYGAGVYPDRAYWETNRRYTQKEINNFNTEILVELSTACLGVLSAEELNEYLKMYWVQVSFSEEELKSNKFLFKLNDILDGLELQEKWQLSETFHIINRLISKGEKKELKRPVYKWRNDSSQLGL